MAPTSGDRAAHFPAIERKHGRPVAYYLDELADLGDAKYQEQIDLLRERHGFSRTHANAVVMYARGSTTSRRVDTPEAYFLSLGGEREVTIRSIFDAIATKYPDLELVIAWNQPMLKRGKDYVFGVSAAKHHLLLGPWGGISETVRAGLKGLEANKKTIRVPVDWTVDAPLLRLMVEERLAQLD